MVRCLCFGPTYVMFFPKAWNLSILNRSLKAVMSGCNEVLSSPSSDAWDGQGAGGVGGDRTADAVLRVPGVTDSE